MLNRTTLKAHYAETDLNIEAHRKQTIKCMSANSKQILSPSYMIPSYMILRIQRAEGKQRKPKAAAYDLCSLQI